VQLLAGILAAAVATSGPALAVDAGADRHPINPDIYGMNFGDPALAREIGLPVNRWGGNRTETYNWRVGAANSGNDWYFENLADCWDDEGAWCSRGNAARDWLRHVDGDAATGTKTLLTLPMMGMVAKDAPLGHPLTCAFPRSRHPDQDAFDPYDSGCGNGRHAGTWLDPVPSDAGTPYGPADAAAWVDAAKARGVHLYELGNEPMLWSETHHALHPERTTYDELWARSRDLAAAVKQADPQAETLGPAEWGWPNYFCSAADQVSLGCFANSPDRRAHDGRPLAEWYLDRMREYEQSTGTRLLDYFDLHYYAQGGVGTTEVTRSLWDPTYTDPSWINDRISLIPRMRAWVDAHYPGTKLALTEYDLTGSPDGIVDTLVQADTLGVFAREGLDLATRWAPPSAGQRQADAWRIFRNYGFGTTWVRSHSADQSRLAVYGAQRTDGTLTVLVINKSGDALASRLALHGVAPAATAQTRRWTGAGIARGEDLPVEAGEIATTYPARSMTLLLIGAAAPADTPAPGATPTPTPTPTRPVAPPVSVPPPPDDRARAGTCVVPRLKGRRLRTARRAMRRAGCSLYRVTRSRRRGVKRGRVTWQTPRAGRKLREGALVEIAVRR
jgi:hypothetical protein